MSAGPQGYWRLSAFYLFYFAFLGALLPFWGLYLQQRGFGLAEIGSLMALLMATKMIAPNLWGWLADRSGDRLGIVRLGSFLAVFIFLGVFLQPGFWGMALVMMGFSFFWNAVLPQFEVITLQSLTLQTRWYSRIRSWGSVGFILAVVVLGWYFQQHDLNLLPVILSTLLALIFVASLWVEKPKAVTYKRGSLQAFFNELWRSPVIIYFGICFLLQVSHGPYYSFYSIYLESLGYSKTSIGWLWSLGVVAEILVFMVVHRLFVRFSERTLLLACLLISATRWWLIGAFSDNGLMITVAQLGHGASFGLFHALAIHCIHRFFSTAAAGQGQAIYSAFSFGAGSALGAFGAGLIVDHLGMADAFYWGAGIALIATGLGLLLRTGNFSAPKEQEGR